MSSARCISFPENLSEIKCLQVIYKCDECVCVLSMANDTIRIDFELLMTRMMPIIAHIYSVL